MIIRTFITVVTDVAVFASAPLALPIAIRIGVALAILGMTRALLVTVRAKEVSLAAAFDALSGFSVARARLASARAAVAPEKVCFTFVAVIACESLRTAAFLALARATSIPVTSTMLA